MVTINGSSRFNGTVSAETAGTGLLGSKGAFPAKRGDYTHRCLIIQFIMNGASTRSMDNGFPPAEGHLPAAPQGRIALTFTAKMVKSLKSILVFKWFSTLEETEAGNASFLPAWTFSKPGVLDCGIITAGIGRGEICH
jgi:hypothetical protein